MSEAEDQAEVVAETGEVGASLADIDIDAGFSPRAESL